MSLIILIMVCSVGITVPLTVMTIEIRLKEFKLNNSLTNKNPPDKRVVDDVATVYDKWNRDSFYIIRSSGHVHIYHCKGNSRDKIQNTQVVLVL